MEHEFINGLETEHGKIALEQIEIAIESASCLGIDRIMIPNFLRNLITTQEHIKNTKEFLTKSCDLAQKKGIIILTENALEGELQRKLLKEVGRENLKIHFDTQNFKFNFNKNQCEQLEKVYDLMDTQMHAKDGILNPGESLLGDGNTDFVGQMKFLRKKGYCGWIVLENYYNLRPLCATAKNSQQMELLKADIAMIKKYLL